MVYMLLAEGFEEIEAVFPLDVLRRCGVGIKTVGVASEYVTGSRNVMIKSDVRLDEMNSCDEITMLIIPGGSGRFNIAKSEQAKALIENCFKANIPVAAICGAPEILGEWGLLKGRKSTCYPGLETKLSGAEFINAAVVIDENLITSQAAGTSEAFAFAIAGFLCGEEKAEEVRKQMVCS
ncbi:MAG: DJ-1/PfpI family protein [Oscillospiraceae bacterium]|nr:DJ-1/PfpI family protein [Oscillospiraceae bacterium]